MEKKKKKTQQSSNVVSLGLVCLSPRRMRLTSTSVNVAHTCSFPFAKQPQAGSVMLLLGASLLPPRHAAGLAWAWEVLCKASQGRGESQ